MKKNVRSVSTLLCIASALFIARESFADTCSDFLSVFDPAGRSLEAIHLDAATTLNEDHIAILVEESGELPTQSAFYAGPTDERKEIVVKNYVFNPDTDTFLARQNARISKVLKGPSFGKGERYLGVWSYGLKSGDPEYFFYLKVVHEGLASFTVVHKQCFANYAEAVALYPELDGIFNTGDPDQTTTIGNITKGGFTEAASHLAESISGLSTGMADLQVRLAKARSISANYTNLRDTIAKMRQMYRSRWHNNKKFDQVVRKGNLLNKQNVEEMQRLNRELGNL